MVISRMVKKTRHADSTVTPLYESLFLTGGCTANDECRTNNGGCSQVCVDTCDSYYCACSKGYQLRQQFFTCNPPQSRPALFSVIIIFVRFSGTVDLSFGCHAKSEDWLQMKS